MDTALKRKRAGTTRARGGGDDGGGALTTTATATTTKKTSFVKTTAATAAAATATRKKKEKEGEKGAPDLETVECKIQELWVDEFRPHEFDTLTYHEDINARLEHLVATPKSRRTMPHLLLYGPNGGGKRTRVQCILNSLYRLTLEQFQSMQFGHSVRDDCTPKTMARESDNTISGIEELTHPQRLCLQLNNVNASSITDVFVLRSPFHLELTPADLCYRDFFVVQQALKAFVESGSQSMFTLMRKHKQEQEREQTQQQRLANMFGAGTGTGTGTGNENDEDDEDAKDNNEKTAHENPQFRVVVINQADRLTHEAQAALRRTMEAYTEHVRFILIAERIEGVIDPIQSRCLPVRVPLVPEPALKTESEGVIERTLRYALRQHSTYTNSPYRVKAFLRNVALNAYGDMTRAFLLMQCSVANLPDYKSVQFISPENDLLQPDWIDTVRSIVDAITVPNLNTSHMNAARSLMRDLQTHCIPPRSIVWTMYTMLVSRCDVEAEAADRDAVSALCADIVWLCAKYECRCVLSHFYVVHLDALLARLMLTIGLHQRGQQYTDDGDKLNARYRAYDTVEPASRRMLHTHRAAPMQNFSPPSPPSPPAMHHREQVQDGPQSKTTPPEEPDYTHSGSNHCSPPLDIWTQIWSFSDIDDLRELKALCVLEPSKTTPAVVVQ